MSEDLDYFQVGRVMSGCSSPEDEINDEDKELKEMKNG